MQCSGAIKGFGEQMANDGIHLNGIGQYKLYRSLRRAVLRCLQSL